MNAYTWTPRFSVRVSLNANNKLMSQAENVKAGPRSLCHVHTVSSRRLTDAKRFTPTHTPHTHAHTRTLFSISLIIKKVILVSSCPLLPLISVIQHQAPSSPDYCIRCAVMNILPRSSLVRLLNRMCRNVPTCCSQVDSIISCPSVLCILLWVPVNHKPQSYMFICTDIMFPGFGLNGPHDVTYPLNRFEQMLTLRCVKCQNWSILVLAEIIFLSI